jgi:tetratricopeptide (TPR) repeat protein
MMKSKLGFLLVICGLLTAAGVQESLADKHPETDAIKKVIIAETNCWARKDYDGWQKTWYHGPEVISVYISKYSHQEKVGWDQIAEAMKTQMTENSEPFEAEITRDNFIIRADGGLAWVTYDESYVLTRDNTRKREWHSRQMRTLVKKNGEWLILSLTGIDDYGYATDFAQIEWDLNMTGHRLLNMGKISEAIDLFAFIVDMYPKSANARESLAEAYTAEGDIDRAVEYYLEAQEIDPDNKNTVEMLEKLKRERASQ